MENATPPEIALASRYLWTPDSSGPQYWTALARALMEMSDSTHPRLEKGDLYAWPFFSKR